MFALKTTSAAFLALLTFQVGNCFRIGSRKRGEMQSRWPRQRRPEPSAAPEQAARSRAASATMGSSRCRPGQTTARAPEGRPAWAALGRGRRRRSCREAASLARAEGRRIVASAAKEGRETSRRCLFGGGVGACALRRELLGGCASRAFGKKVPACSRQTKAPGGEGGGGGGIGYGGQGDATTHPSGGSVATLLPVQISCTSRAPSASTLLSGSWQWTNADCGPVKPSGWRVCSRQEPGGHQGVSS